jgi:hypothetical protein
MIQSQPGQIVHETLSQKNPPQKKKNRAGGVAEGEGPEFKPQNYQKKRVEEENVQSIQFQDS